MNWNCKHYICKYKDYKDDRQDLLVSLCYYSSDCSNPLIKFLEENLFCEYSGNDYREDVKLILHPIQLIGKQTYIRALLNGKINSSFTVPNIHVYQSRKSEYIEPAITKSRWYNYLDSSIWNMRLVYRSRNEVESIKSDLSDLFKRIAEFKKRYLLNNSREYNRLQKELLKIINRATKWVQSKHLNGMSPFLFHSESDCKERILNVKDNLHRILSKQQGLTQLKHEWRLLLVDDCADSKMGRALSCAEDANPKIEVYKKDIIEEDLSFILDGSKKIQIVCVDKIEGAIQKIGQGEIFDIILLDYKLEDEFGEKFGYKLLTKIRENKELQSQYSAPNKQFYFMFISAYTTAVQERLMCENLSTKEKYWFIGRGACPTNTPYLFLYSLLRLMRLRVEDLTKAGEMLGNALDIKKEDEPVTVIDFLTILFKTNEETRMRCVKCFNALLTLRSTYDNIKTDCKQTEEDKKYSRLINSMFPDASCYSNSFWEHLQNLIYLTAFGTIRQWPEMWEDYMFVKNKLMLAEEACKIKENKPSDLIRNYILNLKEQS